MRKGMSLFWIALLLLPTLLGGQEKPLPTFDETKVTIPWSELKELIENYYKAIAPPVKPPRGWVISKASYHGVAGKTASTIKVDFDIQTFGDDWQKVPLTYSKLPLSNATLDGKPASLFVEGGRYHLLLRGTGSHRLSATFVTQGGVKEGPNRVTFPLAEAGVNLLTFRVPLPRVTITANPSQGPSIERTKTSTTVRATLPSSGTVTVEWTRVIEPRKGLKPILNAQVSTTVSVGEAMLDLHSSIDYTVLQGEVKTFQFALSEEADIVDVQGKEVRDYSVTEKEARKVVTVKMGYPVKGTRRIEVIYEKSMGESSAVIDIPVLEVLAVNRVVGYLGVAARTTVEIHTSEFVNLTRIDASDLPSHLWYRTPSPILIAYKYIEHTYQLTLDVRKHEEIPVLTATVDRCNIVTLFTPEGKALTTAVYQVRNNLKQFARLTLPGSTEIYGAFVSDKPVKPAKDEEGNILIPLEKSATGEQSQRSFPVEIIYLSQVPRFVAFGRRSARAPDIDMPVSELFWSVYLPDGFTYPGFGGNLHRISVRYQPARLALIEKGEFEAKAGRRAAKELIPQVELEQRVVEDYQQAMVKGVLPVRIRVPERGVPFRFEKLLVTDETSTLSWRYVASGIGSCFAVLVGFLTAAILFVVGRIYLYPLADREKLSLVFRRQGVWAVVLLVLVIVTRFTGLASGTAILWGVIGAAFCWLIYFVVRWVARKR